MTVWFRAAGVDDRDLVLNPWYWSRGIGEIPLIPSATEWGSRERTIPLADLKVFPRYDDEAGIGCVEE